MKITKDELTLVNDDALSKFYSGIKSQVTRKDYDKILKRVLCDILEDVLEGDYSQRARQICTRAKYSHEFKVEDEEPNDFCDFCGCMFVRCEFIGHDRPPDNEFSGLVDYRDWRALETIDEAVERKEKMSNPSLDWSKAQRAEYAQMKAVDESNRGLLFN